MRTSRCLIAGIVALVSAATGCIDTGALQDLQHLANAINAQYRAPAAVNLASGGELTIMFQNSKYAALAPDERQEFAREVARFAVAQLGERDSLRVVRVGFRAVAGVAGFTAARSEVPYSWSAAELRTLPDSGVTAGVKE